jgi:glutamate synthase (NADPH/NADH) large chain
MAELGYPPLRRDDRPDADRWTARRWSTHWKARGLDFGRHVPQAARCRPSVGLFKAEAQDHELEAVLDRKLIAEAQAALESRASRC